MSAQTMIWSKDELGRSLPVGPGERASEVARDALLTPIVDLMSRPSKGFRAELVRIGASLGRTSEEGEPEPAQAERCEIAASFLEAIHAGSLMVDDVQDGSPLRRGRPAIHRIYGHGQAINAGGWLYFWPLTQLDRLGLPPGQELQVHRDFARVLSTAHCGQAIDLGAALASERYPQESIPEIFEASIRLKTGALTGLALRLGAQLAGAEPERLDALERLGIELGGALQALDDAGNFAQTGPKRLEDLRLGRPSLAWAVAARIAGPTEFRDFVRAARMLPDESYLSAWVAQHSFVERLRSTALERSAATQNYVRDHVAQHHPLAAGQLLAAIRSLENAYG